MAMIMLLGFIALIALPSVLWLYALADVLRNDFRYPSTKIVWAIVLFLFPPLGTVLYFLVGRDQRVTFHPVGRFVILGMFLIPVVMILAYFLFALGHLNFLPEPPKTIQI